ncbi:MAG: hypothetical protein ACK44M_10925 [Chloroflexus sp.]
MRAAVTPQHRVWEAAGEVQGVLVALHGASGSIVNDGDYRQPTTVFGWRVAMLQSTQSWAPNRYHWADTAQALAELRQYLAALAPMPVTVIAGFSMGAALAVRAALSRTVAVNQFLTVAPAISLEQVEPLLTNPDPHIQGHDLDSLLQPMLEWVITLQ